MHRSGRESIPNVRDRSGGPPGCPRVVGSLPRCPGVFNRHSWMSGSGREVLPDDRNRPEGPPTCPGVVERPSRMYAIGREAFIEVREWSGDSP